MDSQAVVNWALFLDFDGTLVDIAERPDAVVVPPGLVEMLGRLARWLDGALAVVTGRAIGDVETYLPGLPVDLCGLHGIERRIAGRFERPAHLADLGPEIARLRQRLEPWPGVVVEDKRVGVAVHWRMAPDAEADAMAAAAELAADLGPGYRVQDGKAVREIVPAHAGKGGAVRTLMEAFPYIGRRPIFIGDDRTDEDAFATVNALDGVAVKVGAGETLALRRLPSPKAVLTFLADFEADPDTVERLPIA